jgi:hypothetical protein
LNHQHQRPFTVKLAPLLHDAMVHSLPFWCPDMKFIISIDQQTFHRSANTLYNFFQPYFPPWSCCSKSTDNDLKHNLYSQASGPTRLLLTSLGLPYNSLSYKHHTAPEPCHMKSKMLLP